MTNAEINAARLANRQAIRTRLAAFKLPAGAKPGRGVDTRPAVILNPTERAALVAAENARPKIPGCCG
jgi:hypothetical protein